VPFIGTVPPQTEWGSGTWLVGVDVPLGRYRVLPTTGSIPHSYWARLRQDNTIIDNDIVNGGPSLVTIQPSDYAIKVDGTLQVIPS
jgi:hypothetical protein